MSLAAHAAATAEVLKFPTVADAVLDAVCLHEKTVDELVVMSVQ